MTQKFVNNFGATIAQTFGAADTYLYLSSAAGLPALGAGDYLLLTLMRKSGAQESGHEVIKVTAITDNMLTVERSVEGAAATLFNVGDHVEARITAGALDVLGAKQDVLVSGSNIKTINNESLLGSGNIVLSTVSISGNLSPYVTQATALTITNYDAVTEYTISATGGTVVRSGETVTYTAGNTAGSFSITINGKVIPITIQAAGVVAPTITAPTAGQTVSTVTPTIVTSAFQSIGLADTHLNSDFELWSAPNRTGTLLASSYADTVNKTEWPVPPGAATWGVPYYPAVRHHGTTLGASSWVSSSFSVVAASVVQPTITAPTAGSTIATLTPSIESGAFQSVGIVDTHLNSDIEIWTGPDRTGTKVASSYADAVNKTSWTPPGGSLAWGTPYYPAFMHRGTQLGASAWATSSFTTVTAAVATPTITSPTNGATGLGQAPTFTSSTFSTIGASDTFLNADHEVRTGPNGTGTLIASSYANTTSETSWTMPGNLLAVATQYYYRKLHRGVSLGAGPWSEISFTTAASFGGLIGTQGGQGFGVGVCTNPSRLTALGLSEMTGTTDKTHANYGNYQHTNGGISVYRPKFFYRIGHPSSPRYATYGANAVDIVGIETFANEAAANAAGYAMPRSFKNAGVEVDGYFRDKYLASKDGTTSCKSIANADPISLTTSASYNPSSTMTGCTGILADAVVLARARGPGWNADFFPMAFDSAIIALAHGQASTSSTYCAWYDASGVTNFPKGCNNGSLADVNDATVTYTDSYSSKPKTRANANFAKTTDNGQECGIADVNGSMWQVMIGLTMAGTSATDTTAITSGNAYLLKTTADFAALTGGFGGAHDAWGTTSSLTTDFDLITGFEPWLGTTGWIYFGNGANAVFSSATSGTDYLRTAAGIPLLTGTNATGTSQFGNDGCYQYGRANQVPLAAGLWVNAAGAGAFSRYWGGSRSYAYNDYGFRCAAY